MIGAFGISKIIKCYAQSFLTDICCYVAPELFNENDYEKNSIQIKSKIDVWSFGCVLYEIICFEKLFNFKAKNIKEEIECLNWQKIKKKLENFKSKGSPVKYAFEIAMQK